MGHDGARRGRGAGRDRRPALVAGGGAVLVGVAGGILTEVGPWYAALRKPSFQPPNWAFAPAWTLILGLAATSAVLAWKAEPEPAERRKLAAGFAANGVLNMAWSLLFFKLRRPDWALAEVAGLWLSIAGLIAACRKRSPKAAWLLAPYLGWVSFASVLNLAIVRLNAPFHGRTGGRG